MFNLLSKAPASAKNDLLSGLTVALALVPEAVAFAFVAGVEPLVGLYAACIVGFITAVLGGRPGMISGATGALAVVMVSLVAVHGVEYLFATLLLMGLLQILAGVFRLGKFIRMVPYPVMLGFVNGLAIVICLAQLPMLQLSTPDGKWGWLSGQWLSGQALFTMVGLIALTMAIVHFLPKLTSAIPSSLAAIVVVSLLVIGLDLPTLTVVDFLVKKTGDVSATIAAGLPMFHVPMVPWTLETLWIVLPYAVVLAAIGLLESLLTLSLIDEITQTRGRPNKECIGQGAANITCGLFGAMGGCAMIGQSMININSGGRSRLSGITAAVMLLVFILVGAPLIEMIPIAALVGVMFMVVLGTFEWASFNMMRKVPRADALVIVLVTVVTVFTDLAVAVMVGVIVSALVFAWQHAKHIYATSERLVAQDNAEPTKVYHLHGPLFFGSVKNFLELFDVEQDPADVVIDFGHSRVADHSAIDAIDTLADRYKKAGKTLHLRHLSADCQALLVKAADLVEVNVIEDPTYKVASDKLA